MSVITQVITSDSASGAQIIDGSLKFGSDTDTELQRTPTSSGNLKTWTWSGWVKRTKIGTNDALLHAGDGSNYTLLKFRDSDTISIDQYGTSYNFYVLTTDQFRDTGWYHVVCAMDTTQGTDSNRVKVYVNGTQVTLTTGTNWPAQNALTRVNESGYNQRISTNGANHFAGYMSNAYLVDGQALIPDSFGFTDPRIWDSLTQGLGIH